MGTKIVIFLNNEYICHWFSRYSQPIPADTGYPHDGRADKDSYLHGGRADKNSYPHDRRADKNPYPHDRNSQCLRLSSQTWLSLTLKS